jgi:hypothetical protein
MRAVASELVGKARGATARGATARGRRRGQDSKGKGEGDLYYLF